ncbi:MAG: TAT-variant-translocated molybdopterin oxidoreductase [Tepidisphaerales bacterium]
MSQIKHHSSGIEYWRSLEQLADSPEVRDLLAREFPGYDPDSIAATSRRRFLKIMGASMALAGVTLSGCRRAPREYLAPYTSNPRDRVPGEPEYYATIFEMGGVGAPLLVTSFDGRPIKVEGNPDHPFSFVGEVGGGRKIGAADTFAQASVLELYDPERSRTVKHEGKPAKWDDFVAFAKSHFGAMKGRGDGLAILSEAASGPSVADMRARLSKAMPGAKWYEYEAVSNDNEAEGHRLAFGAPLRSTLNLDKAANVVLFDADVLGTHPAHIRYAADWAARRRTADNKDDRQMNRVYIAESTFSVTGTVADVRLPADPDRIHALARAVATKLGVAGISGKEELSGPEAKFVEAAAAELKHDGVAAAGPAASAQVHALVAAINAKIGAVGKTVAYYDDPSFDRRSHMAAIAALAKQIDAGTVTTLVILGGNPAYDTPADLGFGRLLGRVGTTIQLSLYENELSKISTWHLPRAHYLESWGDARAYDGTASVTQPLIEPLYGGKSSVETLAVIVGDELADGHAIVQRAWAGMLPKGDAQTEFKRVLESGLLKGTEYKTVSPQIKSVEFAPAAAGSGFYLRFEPDSRVHDGRFANNGWLQETPDPLSKLCWDNALMVSKVDADKLGVATGDTVSAKAGAGSLQVAVYVMPGQPVGVVGLSLGYGRTAAGHVGSGLGFDAYGLRTSRAAYVARGVQVSKAAGTYLLAMTQNHHIIDPVGAEIRDARIGPKGGNGPVIREASLEEYKANPRFADMSEGVALQLFDQKKYTGPHAWGMTVDMATCIGCNACAVACQAENNIPIVGKEQVNRHREMNWIRIDRYFKGAADDPTVEVVFQPLMCVHCENAPCEQVCPVGATMHDSEGLNTMVYNRCIGTRYCSNNCPYKVRRFNYFDFHSKDPRGGQEPPWLDLPDTEQAARVDKIKRMVFNPDVTVRMRGVMEKCTYCVQRIHGAEIKARAQAMQEKETSKDVQVPDGMIVTACQQACPTQAIVFGNLNDPQSLVSRIQRENTRAYSLLEELNVRPRTKHLAKLRNPGEKEETR